MENEHSVFHNDENLCKHDINDDQSNTNASGFSTREPQLTYD